jgi:hypothetical protein
MKLGFKGLIMIYIGLSTALVGVFILGYGYTRASVEYKILELPLSQTNYSTEWWDRKDYQVFAVGQVYAYYEDVLRVREIIKPPDWKGYNAEIFIFFGVFWAGEPIALQCGEDVAYRRSGQVFIGQDGEVGIQLAAVLPVSEMEGKNYFGNWSVHLDYIHRTYGDTCLRIIGTSLTVAGVTVSVASPLHAWRTRSKLQKLSSYL